MLASGRPGVSGEGVIPNSLSSTAESDANLGQFSNFPSSPALLCAGQSGSVIAMSVIDVGAIRAAEGWLKTAFFR